MAISNYAKNESEYLSKNPNWHEEDSPWKAKQVLKMLNRISLEPNTISEIGCGTGEILNQLHKKMSTEVTFSGFDISPDAILRAKTKMKERLVFHESNLIESNEKFDLLLMMDVFEHVPDYLGFLGSCRKNANHFIFHIPLDINVWGLLTNAIIAGRKSVGHLHYFTRDTALATLHDSGYDIKDSFYTTWYFDLTPKKTIRKKLKSFLIKTMYQWKPDLTVKLFSGFSLLVYAQSMQSKDN